MNYNIYIDESGNTGNIEAKEDYTWNFQNQTHFTLGAIYFQEKKSEEFEKKVRDVLQKYDPKLGNENELKSKGKYTFKNELLAKLLELFNDHDVRCFFDISDKRFKVIMNIVEYCVYPYYQYGLGLYQRDDKIVIANFLYNYLSDEYVKFYIDLCQDVMDEEVVIEKLSIFLKMLENLLRQNKHKQAENIESIIYIIQHLEESHLKLENVLPIKDFNNKGNKESFLPNVDAFNNLLSNVCKLRLSYGDKVCVYHDNQKQFSNVLAKWGEKLNEYGAGITSVDFYDSKDYIMLQIADFLTGTIARLYKDIIAQNYLNRETRELVKIMKPLLCNCNIVDTRYRQLHFFEQCGMKYIQSPIPILY